VAIDYDRPMRVVDGMTVTFRDAGHILGAAQVVLDIEESDRKYRYLSAATSGAAVMKFCAIRNESRTSITCR
jgi:metallo-beta-lactamase family protein